jgi:signal transduction histidine kinase
MNNTEGSVNELNIWQNILSLVEKILVNADDDDETHLYKSVQLVSAIMVSVAAIIWGVIYLSFGEYLAGSIPLTFAAVTILSLLVLRVYKIYQFFRFSQILMFLILPFLLMASLGGFIIGSVVIIWGFFAPIAALLSGQVRLAVYWFIAFVLLVLVSGFIQPYLRTENNLPELLVTIFFIINLGTVSFIVFLVLFFFFKRKDNVIELMRTNRELELAYLQQEVMLRQSEKLATLGKLSAGMAHELNNPASVALRGSKQLQDTILEFEKRLFGLGQMNLSAQQLDNFSAIKGQIYINIKKPVEMDSLERSDRETEIESWLENQNIEDPWDLASMLVSLNFSVKDLSILAENFSGDKFPTILSTLQSIYVTHNLLEEIGQGTGRITEIVKSLKSYTYLDKAPIQSVDIHEGLNDTLVMLRSQLKDGITVQKEFDESLPHIQAYGSELNQVWTNIIDNAVSAMNGKGEIVIKTFNEEPWLVVQIIDTGPGIPKGIQGKVFDPFFTTKPPGEGTGLGLNISYNIIVQKHKGKISVISGQRETCFEVKLPLDN